uniref:ATP synthase subunit a n=1 Tax=Nabicula flavomarginata TaxID=1656685 RepID=A0A343ISB7_9HEMI|nr:ATP synthase F0 subunit 6 [Nabicula flavomarginata]AST10129.1 ATP synthase F0 subunit 6 [Nabicula flavomarginata]
MMNNLFSAFDPATSNILSMNWISTLIVFMLIPLNYWMLPSRYNMLMHIVMDKLHNEFKTLLTNKTKGFTLMFVSLFMFILMNNIYGLIPYIFTSSSHLVFSLALSLPLWLSLMLFGWINHTQHMFAHLIPMGTPPLLMPFMVLIETTSNFIRPGSLAVRLTANMIAGHLLMSLLGNNSINASTMVMSLLLTVQMVLMLFETAVSIIQAYVFSVLSTLYSSEVVYENT